MLTSRGFTGLGLIVRYGLQAIQHLATRKLGALVGRMQTLPPQPKRTLNMLNLTRRPNQSIIITTADGQEIEVVVLGIRGNQVRIGIAADDSIEILRAELLDDAA